MRWAAGEDFDAVANGSHCTRHLVSDYHRCSHAGQRVRPIERNVKRPVTYSWRWVPQIPHQATSSCTWPGGGGGVSISYVLNSDVLAGHATLLLSHQHSLPFYKRVMRT